MNTKCLKKRDRDWAKGMVYNFTFNDLTCRRWHSTRGYRARLADEALEWELGNDPFQQEALTIKP